MIEMPVIAKDGATELGLEPAMVNRHGLVAGATGTGKTVRLQVMAEALSAIGVPVFAADVKGDLSGILQPGKSSAKFDARVAAMGLGPVVFAGCPVVSGKCLARKATRCGATVTRADDASAGDGAVRGEDDGEHGGAAADSGGAREFDGWRQALGGSALWLIVRQVSRVAAASWASFKAA